MSRIRHGDDPDYEAQERTCRSHPMCPPEGCLSDACPVGADVEPEDFGPQHDTWGEHYGER